MPKKTVHEIVADELIKMLESADMNWRKPWFPLAKMPQNIRGNKYSGINVFLLAGKGQYFATYKQWSEKKCQVIKGSKGHIVVFYKTFEKEDDNGDIKKIPTLRFYKVFALDQVEGEYADKLRESMQVDLNTHEAHEASEKAIAAYLERESISVDQSDRASYIPSQDRITMPLAGQFDQVENYYSTYFHEMAHSTGHKTRLDRDLSNGFGSLGYAFEELVAEFSAAMACAELGLSATPRADHAQYIKGWIKGLKEKPQAAVSAAAKAQKAVNMFLGLETAT